MPTELEKALFSSGHARDFAEAKHIQDKMRSAVTFEGEDHEDVLSEYGLEPDYIFDIL